MKFRLADLESILPKDKFAFLSSFLAYCTKDILNQMQLCDFESNHILMYTGDSSEYVYILLTGGVDAVDEGVPNIPYTFTELDPVDVVGDYELFSNAVGRYVTLRTIRPTMCIRIPSSVYLAWLKQDNNALFIRMQLLLRVLSLETQFYRQYLFLDNETRFALFLLEECQKRAVHFPHTVNADREHIVSKIGCSTRTLNRTISNLEKLGLIYRKNGKITIDKKNKDKIVRFIKESEANLKLTLPKL